MDAEGSALSFLQALWPAEPLPGSLVVWTKSRRGEKTSSWCATLAEAAEAAAQFQRDCDVYFSVALQNQDRALAIARRERPTSRLFNVRGFSASATALPGLWMDLDIQAPAHRETALPPDLSSALSLLEAFPYESSVIVHSGFGIHAYWLFHEPWVFGSEEDRSEARQLVTRLQKAVRTAAARRGWILEGTADLARVLRLPGTFNHKADPPKAVVIEGLTLDRRYNPSEFEEVLPERAAERPTPAKKAEHETGPPADMEAILEGCAWLRHSRDDRATLPEPEWYATLGILGRCAMPGKDGRQQAHEWSEGHPGYTPQETDQKLDQALRASGPRTCRYIAEELGARAAYCSKCPNDGRIKSPIVLGRGRRAPGGSIRVDEPAAESDSNSKGVSEAVRALEALGDGPEPEEVRRALSHLARCLDGAAPLAVHAAREAAVRALKGKVRAPVQFVGAALAGLARTANPAPPAARGREGGPPYREAEQGLEWLKATREGEVPVPLTNFLARIVGQVERDDGVQVQRSFLIEARHQRRDRHFEVSAARFQTMAWVAEHLGANAVVYAGFGIRDHSRAAIQLLSAEVPARTVYTHLGWRQIAGEWCYLHAEGAVAAGGTVPTVETDPPSQLRLFALLDPPGSEDLRSCLRASLQTLDVLPDEVTIPVFCAIWRSVLGACDFSLHLAGQTGEGKSELAALAQQHFGPGLDARHLPGSWSSTGNALEALAFAAKDALLVVDDFAPEGSAHDIQRQHQEAARLFRAQGNRSGRSRLRPDGELRLAMAPRGLVLSTGEDVPRAHSIRARLLVLEVPAGAMDWALLTECQEAAREGLFARELVAFLQWLSSRYDRVQGVRLRRTAELRARAASATAGHRRTPSIVAELAHGLEVFLTFAREVGVLHATEAQRLWERGWAALGEAGAAQAEHLGIADPVRRFRELLASAVAAGRAHVAAGDGAEPDNPAAWGWRDQRSGAVRSQQEEWRPLGDRVGWFVDGALYLDPDASFRVAQAMASVDGLTVTPRTLWKRLKECGVLAATDEPRRRNTVRVTLQGARREVLHLTAEALMPEKPSQSSQPSQGSVAARADGTVLWDGSELRLEEPSQGTVPEAPEDPGFEEPAGTVGTIGTVSSAPAGEQAANWEEV